MVTAWAAPLVLEDARQRTNASPAFTAKGANQAPVITSVLPREETVYVLVGSTQVFLFSAADHENDPLTARWELDDILVGQFSTFTYLPAPGETGSHTLTLTVSDDNPESPDATHQWTVQVVPPDATPTPTLTVTPAPTQTPTPVPTATITSTVTPTLTATVSPTSTRSPIPSPTPNGDFNGDERIDDADLLILYDQWHE
jgi:hypothetical protein